MYNINLFVTNITFTSSNALKLIITAFIDVCMTTYWYLINESLIYKWIVCRNIKKVVFEKFWWRLFLNSSLYALSPISIIVLRYMIPFLEETTKHQLNSSVKNKYFSNNNFFKKLRRNIFIYPSISEEYYVFVHRDNKQQSNIIL